MASFCSSGPGLQLCQSNYAPFSTRLRGFGVLLTEFSTEIGTEMCDFPLSENLLVNAFVLAEKFLTGKKKFFSHPKKIPKNPKQKCHRVAHLETRA